MSEQKLDIKNWNGVKMSVCRNSIFRTEDRVKIGYPLLEVESKLEIQIFSPSRNRI